MASIDHTIQAKRPDGKIVTVTRAAFDGIYRYRGWHEVTDTEPEKPKPAPRKRTTRRKQAS